MVAEHESFEKIREVESDLYDGFDEPESGARARLHGSRASAPELWAKAQEAPKKIMTKLPKTWYKKFFLGASVFFILAILFTGYTFLSGGNSVSNKYITLTVLGKTFADGGEELPLQIQIENRNRTPLELAKLIIEYPEGRSDNPDAVARIDRALGTVSSGESRLEDVTVRLYGEEGSEKNITARLEYRVPNSNSIFEKTGSLAIVLRSSPVRVVVNGPESSAPNQEITYDITVTSNATDPIKDAMIQATYPAGIEFVRADREVSYGENTWLLGDLEPGARRTLRVTVRARGVENDVKNMLFAIGTQDPNNERNLLAVFQTLSKPLALTRAFLTASISVNNSSDEQIVAQANEPLSVQIAWQNSLPTTVSNAEVTVSLSGSAYDKRGVAVQNGYFDSTKNTITWSGTGTSQLNSVGSGDGGTLSFSISPASLATPSSVILAPEISIAVSVRGTGDGGKILEALNVDQKKVLITSDVRLTTKTLHHSGAFQNTGPMPPRVEQTTTYTLVWQIANSSNRLSEAQVTTTLPVGIKWTGKTQGSGITYNESTRKVSWTPGTVDRAIGFQGVSPIQASFQVSITPSVNQLNTVVDLTNRVEMTATDTNTRESISKSQAKHTTSLSGDTSTVGSGRVLP